LLDSLRDIVRVTSVPITVDVENGYSDDPQAVAELIADVAGAGAIGINLEDGTGTPEQLAAKIRAIRAHLGNASLFINARTDVYLRKMASGDAAIGMTTERLQMYGAAGADGGFVPLLADVDAAARIAAKVPLALNVMTVPALLSLTALHAAGVRRVSTRPFLFRVAYGAAQQAARAFLDGDPALLYASSLEGGTLNGLFSAPR
jgi:2-methylisocitrate lyase-like PEP mutase family enzyme